MQTKAKAKLAVIGIGNMGSNHSRDILKLENTELAAICDIDKERADRYGEEFGVPVYYDYHDLFHNDQLDGVVVATPHYDHTPISIDFLSHGTHVLTEKPIAVHVKDAHKMIEAYLKAREKYPELLFAAMFQQRTLGYWRKIKDMIDRGELGRLMRATWIITDWFRTQFYYDSGGWRATWRGEGGGVLLNQCPHNLDLFQWFVGVPDRVSGFATIGKYHHIEVEDEVTGFFEYENGMVGHFITTTAESPGTNRLEIVGENGVLICEREKILFDRNQASAMEFIRDSDNAWNKVPHFMEEVSFESSDESGHANVIHNFANAILNSESSESLIAPAVEGVRSLMLGNAIMLSSFLGRPVSVPIDEDEYETRLMELVRTSKFQKETGTNKILDIGDSFH